ncbi:Gfo/Idh/MocA family protein [Paenibacillus sp. S150]|uniref:Gfo/Idh/MocA family protein n=1 Tax=Paenibacillus sp. S150 TaxID=2749826 RepID=UPI001C55D83B|nr:Gfo/Idh/MocA family oxidoreductase [Paenibacillus sp. S150]MBW4080772.1 Gfo/Idh/MocA family oxidoreductase [Paenibacillus sp. S150]
MIRTAVIGCGGMGNIHADRYMSMPEAELVAVCDVKEESAEALGRLAGVNYYLSARELLEREKPEVVSIAVPTFLHVPLVCLAADYGAHVICEKPLALTSREAEEAVRYCAGRGVRLFVGHVVRFFPSYRQLAEGVQLGGTQGGIYHAKRAGSHPGRVQEWFRDPALSGGVIIDLMIHDIDYIRGAFGDAAEVYAFQHQSDTMDYASATFRFENGTLAQLEAFWGYPGSFHTSFEYADAEVIISGGTPDGESLLIRRAVSSGSGSGFVETPSSVLLQDPYYEELEHFLGCLASGAEPMVTAEDAVEAVRWAEAAGKSGATGLPVKLKAAGGGL